MQQFRHALTIFYLNTIESTIREGKHTRQSKTITNSVIIHQRNPLHHDLMKHLLYYKNSVQKVIQFGFIPCQTCAMFKKQLNTSLNRALRGVILVRTIQVISQYRNFNRALRGVILVRTIQVISQYRNFVFKFYFFPTVTYHCHHDQRPEMLIWFYSSAHRWSCPARLLLLDV